MKQRENNNIRNMANLPKGATLKREVKQRKGNTIRNMGLTPNFSRFGKNQSEGEDPNKKIPVGCLCLKKGNFFSFAHFLKVNFSHFGEQTEKVKILNKNMVGKGICVECPPSRFVGPVFRGRVGKRPDGSWKLKRCAPVEGLSLSDGVSRLQ